MVTHVFIRKPPTINCFFLFVCFFQFALFVLWQTNVIKAWQKKKKEKNAGWDETKKPCIYNTTENNTTENK